MKRISICLVAVLIVSALVIALNVHVAPLGWGWHQPYDTVSGIAVRGYDPVAYHLQAMAQLGSPSISWTWQGAEWHFSSIENMGLFQADPQRYAPRVGGHCTIAVSVGTTASADPKVWHIRDQKLYMFFDEGPKAEFLAFSDAEVAAVEKSWAAALGD